MTWNVGKPPEDGETYLIWCDFHEEIMLVWYDKRCEWFTDGIWDESILPTHWQNLPKQP